MKLRLQLFGQDTWPARQDKRAQGRSDCLKHKDGQKNSTGPESKWTSRRYIYIEHKNLQNGGQNGHKDEHN